MINLSTRVRTHNQWAIYQHACVRTTNEHCSKFDPLWISRSRYIVWIECRPRNNQHHPKHCCGALCFFCGALTNNKIIIILKSYIAHVSTEQGTQGAEHIYKLSERKVIAVMNSETQCSTLLWFTRCYGAYSSHSQEHRGEPLLFSKCALGSFTCITQHMGPTALHPIRRTKQWLSVLLKETSVTAGDSNPHSADQKHQSEFGALNRLATPLPQDYKLTPNLDLLILAHILGDLYA